MSGSKSGTPLETEADAQIDQLIAESFPGEPRSERQQAVTIASLCRANAELGALYVGLLCTGDRKASGGRREAAVEEAIEGLAKSLPADVVDPPGPVEWALLRSRLTHLFEVWWK